MEMRELGRGGTRGPTLSRSSWKKDSVLLDIHVALYTFCVAAQFFGCCKTQQMCANLCFHVSPCSISIYHMVIFVWECCMKYEFDVAAGFFFSEYDV